jgi:hypothetical protein
MTVTAPAQSYERRPTPMPIVSGPGVERPARAQRRPRRVARLATAVAVTAAGILAAWPGNGRANTAAAPLIIVMMENHGYPSVVGNPAMPFLNSLWNEGANGTGPVSDYTRMYAVTHPSLPNYLAISSGSTWGITGSATVSPGEFAGPSLWDQLSGAGISWGVFEEAMPGVCSPDNSFSDTAAGGTDGRYVLKHNPGTLYASVYPSSECQNVQPLSALSADASGGTLPQVSFVTPNLCDDDHGIPSGQPDPFTDCVTGTTALEQRGDSWLQSNVSAWTAAGADVLITWDEGGGTAGVDGTSGGGEVAALLTGPGVTPGQDATQYSHYSVLAGVEDRYGLPLLGNAGTANPVVLPDPPPSTAPAVTISQPAGGSTVSGSITVAGTAQPQGGASISEVQLSVDGGAAQPVSFTTDASGTADWTTTLDTTTLPNGSNTITAEATAGTGAVGSATTTFSVDNPSTTSCPATAPGATELSGNLSVEGTLAGWTGKFNSNSVISRVAPPGGSYDGLWAVEVGVGSGSGAAGVNNADPIWVPGSSGLATTAGQAYTASAFVSASAAGEDILLTLRETTSQGKAVGYHTTTVQATGTGWFQITTQYTAQNTGDALHYTVHVTNLADPSQSFLADCLSLQTP